MQVLHNVRAQILIMVGGDILSCDEWPHEQGSVE